MVWAVILNANSQDRRVRYIISREMERGSRCLIYCQEGQHEFWSVDWINSTIMKEVSFPADGLKTILRQIRQRNTYKHIFDMDHISIPDIQSGKLLKGWR